MTDELYHHGILKQKWGIRRYQNPDGTLTEAGKLRYGSKGSNISSVKQLTGKPREQYEKDIKSSYDSQKNILSEAKNVADTLAERTSNFGKGSVRKNGNYRNLSTKELKKRVNRLSLERQYSDLVGDTKYVMSGRDKVREVLQTGAAILGIGTSAVMIAAGLKQLKGG